MRVLNETDKYLESINQQTEEKEEQNTEQLLGAVKEVFSSLTSAIKDLEQIMTTLQLVKGNQEEEEKEGQGTPDKEE